MGKLLRLAVVWFACAFCIMCGVVLAQSEMAVTGIASNDYVGEVECDFVVEDNDISGTCSNDYFGNIIVGDHASLEANGDVYNVEGYGEFANPFTVTDATYNYVYFDQGSDPVRVIGTEITGTMTNAIVGNMVFGVVAIPVCGNGDVEHGEECDDDNTVSGDGCSSTCDVESETAEIFTLAGYYPLNGSLDVAVNQPFTFIFSEDVDSDSFETNADFGTVTGVSFQWLTDAIVRVSHDVLANNTLYTVTIPVTVQSDVGGRALDAERSFSFRTVVSGVTVSPVTCGDGYVITGEQCDDGNVRSGDGCSAVCAVETGWSCANTPSYCYQIAPACGDGHVDMFTETYYGYGSTATPEGCDDGNVVVGDGCNETCEAETGFQCYGTHPSICLVLSGQTVEIPEIVFPTVFTWYDTAASARVSSEDYRVYLPGHEVVGADWMKYDAETGAFYVDTLPSGLSVGEYLFTVRNISTGDISNAKILIADVAKFFSPEGEPLTIQWLTAIISAAEDEDPAELGIAGKTGQVAMFLSLMREIESGQ